MTTIAAKDGVMACDSCWTDSNGLYGTSLTKIIRLKSGALLGEAGDVDNRAVVKLLQGCKTFDQLPTALELAATCANSTSLLMLSNGEMASIYIGRIDGTTAYEASVWKVNRGGAAVGSGAQVALGAMDSGKSARQAVEIACRRDVNSKPPVHHVALKLTSKRKPRAAK
jgi:hypothetical protein